MIKKILSALIISTTLLMFGCDNNSGGNNSGTPPEKPDKKIETDKNISDNGSEKKSDGETPVKVKAAQIMEIKIYYPDESGSKLVAVNRKIETNDTINKYLAAVNELIKKPQEKYLTDIFPKNTKVIDVKLSGDTAVVNFDKNISTHFVGGSTGEEFLVGSVVATLTEFPEVNRVRFLVEGKEVETLAGHMDLSVPIKRPENLLK